MEPLSPYRERDMSMFMNERVRQEARQLAEALAKDGQEQGELAVGDATLHMTSHRDDLFVVLDSFQVGEKSYHLGAKK